MCVQTNSRKGNNRQSGQQTSQKTSKQANKHTHICNTCVHALYTLLNLFVQIPTCARTSTCIGTDEAMIVSIHLIMEALAQTRIGAVGAKAKD